MAPKHFVLFISLILANGFNPAFSAKSASRVVKDLRARYKKIVPSCRSHHQEAPAYECSGLMIHGVNNKRNLPFPWGMKPFNKKKHSFSVAYLRKDAQWHRLPFGHSSGFILYPHDETPPGKNAYKVYCAFPLDASSDLRAGKHACGTHKFAKSKESGHCNSIGITTFHEWRRHFKRVERPFSRNQCSFDMTSKSAPRLFKTLLKATKFLMGKKFRNNNNELKVHSWNEKNAKDLPIEAFFYVIGSKTGKQTAKGFQRDYKRASGGEIVPVVGIQFPNVKTQTPFKVIHR